MPRSLLTRLDLVVVILLSCCTSHDGGCSHLYKHATVTLRSITFNHLSHVVHLISVIITLESIYMCLVNDALREK
jgi:hypothetical protein